MLRGTRENSSFLALITNSAGVAMLCFLLLGSTVVAVIPQPSLHSTMLSSAYAQQAEGEGEGNSDEEPSDTQTSDEEPSDTQTSDEEPSDTQTSDEEPPVSESDALITLQTLVGLAGVNTPQELQELAAADSPNELAQMAGTSDSQELAAEPGITDSQSLNAIAEAPNLQGLAELIGMSIPEMLRTLFPPSPPPVEEPPTEEPPVEEPPAEEELTAQISSN